MQTDEDSCRLHAGRCGQLVVCTRTVRTRRGKYAKRTQKFWRLSTKFSSLTQVRDIWTAKSCTDKPHFSVYMYVIKYNGQCPLHSMWARHGQTRTNSSMRTVRGQTRCRGLSCVQEARGGLLVNLVALEDREVIVGIRCIILENLSTMTRIESYSSDFGKGPIISIDISCQGCSGISKGLSETCPGWRIILFFWHAAHPFT
jgi:hypothetical protein